jgi:hypothetical protein
MGLREIGRSKAGPRPQPCRLLLLCAVLVPVAHAQSEPTRYRLETGLDVSYVAADGHPSWLQGSAGKLRYDGDNDGMTLSRGFADYELRLADTLNAHVAAEAYDDGIGAAIDLTEAYLEWRPLSATANRYRVKLGAFYPRISLENTAPGWSSPYTINSSAINTWVGEELRAWGAEFSMSRRPASLGGNHTFSLQGAVFYNNDTAGGLMAWKGWSLHDRQSRINDEIPLPPIPQIQPGMFFDQQDPYITPNLEIDGTYGFYVNGEWEIRQRLLLRVMHYNNRTDPLGYEDGQYAWWTFFDHVGMQATLPGDVGLFAQWMEGYTAWGTVFDGEHHAVDNEFRSYYLMLTKSVGRQRFALRFDNFEVHDEDTTPLDDNSEEGHAFTVSWQFHFTPTLTLAAEWLAITTERPAWAYFGLDEKATERQLQLSARLRFGSR